jgi:hypothetical protein
VNNIKLMLAPALSFNLRSNRTREHERKTTVSCLQGLIGREGGGERNESSSTASSR